MDQLLGTLRRRRWAIAIGALTVAVGLGVAAACSTSFMVGATLAVGVLGFAANLAMAIGALAVVVTWRKQIQGTSQHDVAKRIAIELQDVLTHGTELLIQWFNWRNADDAGKRTLNERLFRSHAALCLVISSMKRLTIEVRAIWGQVVAAPLEAFIGGECVGFVVDVQTEINGDLQDAVFRTSRDDRYDNAKPDGLWHQRFKAWIKFIDDWAIPYVGRGNVEPMTQEEFARRYEALLRPIVPVRTPSVEPRTSSVEPPSEATTPSERPSDPAQHAPATPPDAAGEQLSGVSTAVNDGAAKR